MGSLTQTRRRELLQVLERLCSKQPSTAAMEAAKQRVKSHEIIKVYEDARTKVEELRKKFTKSMRELGREANQIVGEYADEHPALGDVLDDLDLLSHFEVKMQANPLGKVNANIYGTKVQASVSVRARGPYSAGGTHVLVEEDYDNGADPVAEELLAMAKEEAKLATTEKELINLIRRTKSEINALEAGEEDERRLQSGEGDDRNGAAPGESGHQSSHELHDPAGDEFF